MIRALLRVEGAPSTSKYALQQNKVEPCGAMHGVPRQPFKTCHRSGDYLRQ